MEFLPFTDHDNRYSIAQVTKHLDTIVEATVPQNRRGLKLMSPAESARLGRLWLDAEERLVEQEVSQCKMVCAKWLSDDTNVHRHVKVSKEKQCQNLVSSMVSKNSNP